MKITGWEKRNRDWINNQSGRATTIAVLDLGKKLPKRHQLTVIGHYDFIVSPTKQEAILPKEHYFNIHVRMGHEAMFGKWFKTKEEAETAAIAYMKRHPTGLPPSSVLYIRGHK